MTRKDFMRDLGAVTAIHVNSSGPTNVTGWRIILERL